jgi:hypothetical protein
MWGGDVILFNAFVLIEKGGFTSEGFLEMVGVLDREM